MKFVTSLKKNIDYPYILLLFILICVGSNTLYTQVLISTTYSAYFVFGLSVMIFFMKNKLQIRLRYKESSVLVIIFFLIVMTMLLNVDVNNFNGYILIFMKIIGAFFLLSALDFERFKNAFSNVLYLLAIGSLIITYVLPVFSLEKLLPVVTNGMGIKFYNGFLAFKIISYGTFEIRNYGIFSEPAVYCFFLFLAAVFEYSKDMFTRKTIIKLMVFIFTMVTTFSPIGFITAIIMFGLSVHKIRKNTSNKMNLLIPVVCVLCILWLFMSNSDMNSGFDFMIGKIDVLSGNGSGRIDCFRYNIDEWIKNPFFGGGLKSVAEVAGLIGYNTSTTGVMLSGFGFMFTVIITILQYKSMSIVLKRRNIIVSMILFMVFMLQINNHGLIQADWYWIFTMIGVAEKKSETFNLGQQFGKYRV